MSQKQDRKDLYVGYLAEAPQAYKAFSKTAIIAMLLFALLGALSFVLGQQAFSSAVFEFQQYRAFQGILQREGHPHLLVQRPGLAGQNSRFSVYLLVAPFKFGASQILDEAALQHNDLIRLEGSLIYDAKQSMIEIKKGTLEKLAAAPAAHRPLGRSLGWMRLKGQIVDSKCYLGVMKPAVAKIHRSCAVRCLSGGVPPLFVVQEKNGEEHYFLLVSPEGKMINKAILDFTAKPVEIQGYVKKKEGLLILHAKAESIRIID